LADRGVGLGPVLTKRADALALHDGPIDMRNHPGRSIGEVACRPSTSRVRVAVPSNNSMMSRT
jgi:hypothetical protein